MMKWQIVKCGLIGQPLTAEPLSVAGVIKDGGGNCHHQPAGGFFDLPMNMYSDIVSAWHSVLFL